MKKIVTFQCDLCEGICQEEEDAQECEARGIVKLPLYRLGEFVLVNKDESQGFKEPVRALVASVDIHEDWTRSCHDDYRLIVYEIAIRVSTSPYDRKTGFDPVKFFDIAEEDILGRLNLKTNKVSKPRRHKRVTSFDEYYKAVDVNNIGRNLYQDRLRSMRHPK